MRQAQRVGNTDRPDAASPRRLAYAQAQADQLTLAQRGENRESGCEHPHQKG
jgi:hypothetical protein